MIYQITATFLLSIFLSVVFAPVGIFLAWRFKLIDQPGSEAHKIHATPMPRAGGLIIFFVVVVGNALIGIVTSYPIAPVISASVIILAFGIWDDIHGMLAPWKLLGQFLASMLLILQGVMVHITLIPAVDALITLFWLIGIANAYNLVDSMNGLAAGLGGITSILLLMGVYHAGQFHLALFGAILLGCSIGVFYFNFSLSRLFLGDSGTQLLGFFLASLAIVYNPPGLPQASSWFVPILLFCVPIFDTTLVTLSRIRRRVPIYAAKLDHTYHRLVATGLSPARSVFILHLISFLIGTIAFLALFLQPIWANMVFGLVLAAGFVAYYWLDLRER